MSGSPQPTVELIDTVVELDIAGTVSSTLSFVPGPLLVLRALRDASEQTPVGTITSIEPSTPLVRA